MTVLAMDKEKLTLLQARYDEAVAAGEESFLFEESEILTLFAKHLLAYLEDKLDNPVNVAIDDTTATVFKT